jgi:hypothetical protein
MPITLPDFDKEQFLQGEILGLTIGGAFSRGKVYRERKPVPTEAEKRKLRKAIAEHLNRLKEEYREKVADEKHVRNITQLAEELSGCFCKILRGDHLRIGTAQKLLNLYLKYYWVLGRICEPPHCPLDGTIIAKLKLNTKINWTELDCVDQYRALIKAAREAAKKSGLSIAVWELKKFKRKTA